MTGNKWFRVIGAVCMFGVPLLIVTAGARYVSLGINITRSLPYYFFIVVHTKHVNKGDFVVFRPPKNAFISQNNLLLKRISGVAGDKVSYLKPFMYINQHKIGRVLQRTKKGKSLHPGPTGIIPINKFYASAPHPHSFDSRYAELGWLDQSQIIGRAIVLW